MASGAEPFALNHMTAQKLRPAEFFALARNLGIIEVEIRNDLAGNAILDGSSAASVRDEAQRAGVGILSINALQRFNEWTAARASEAEELADYAAGAGARALVLVPRNDGDGRGDGERLPNLIEALQGLKPILSDRGLIGLVEPLGFEVCSLRLKSEAVAGIDAVDGAQTFKLVHDTFHHHLAGEAALFPNRTGLVHISGVDDASVSVPDMRDSHRGLVGANDRLGNIAQIKALRAGGYAGALSFEPFAESIQKMDARQIQDRLAASMALIATRLAS